MHADVSFKAGGGVLSIMRENCLVFRRFCPMLGLISMKRTLSLSLLAIAGLCLSQLGCGEDKPTSKAGTAGPDKGGTSAELKIEDLKEGTGPAVKAGDTVEVHYTGWLKDGKKFDSSLDRKAPLPFTVGAGNVIKGWDQGIVGMKVGGKRKLVIPPDLAYGKRGYSPVLPPDAELTFDIELMSIK